MIVLNVGGTDFATNISTLTDRSGYFKAYFKFHEKDTEHFIDRSPRGFKHVLDYLRDPNYIVPNKWLYELDFYQIKHNLVPTKNISNYLDRINNNLEKLNANLEKIDYNLERKTFKQCSECNELCDDDNYCTQCNTCNDHCGHYSGCWLDNMLVKLDCNSLTPTCNLKIGDNVWTGSGYSKILAIYKANKTLKKMVNINGIYLTHGHPIYDKENGWIRAREKYNTICMKNVDIADVLLDKIHEIILYNPNGDNNIKVATINKFEKNWRK